MCRINQNDTNWWNENKHKDRNNKILNKKSGTEQIKYKKPNNVTMI